MEYNEKRQNVLRYYFIALDFFMIISEAVKIFLR
jgi:hypothetical protein